MTAPKFKYVEFIESNNLDIDKLKQSTQDTIVEFSNEIEEAIKNDTYEALKDDFSLIDDEIVETLKKELEEKGDEKEEEQEQEEEQKEETPEAEKDEYDKKRQPSEGGRTIPTKKVKDPRGMSLQEIVDTIKAILQFIFENGLAGIGGAGGGNDGFSEEQREQSCAIEKYIEEKHDKKEAYSEADIEYVQKYYEGNCKTQDPIQHQYLHQYFISDKLSKKAWALAYHYGYDFGAVFNPFSGKGNLLKYAPKSAIKIVNDIDFYLEQIALNSYPNTVKCDERNEKGNYDSKPYEYAVKRVPNLWSKLKVPTPSLFISAPPCMWITEEDLGDYMSAYEGHKKDKNEITNEYFGFIGVPYYMYALATQLAMCDTDDLVVMIITADQTANQYLFGEIQTILEKKDAIEYSPDLKTAYTGILKDAVVMDIYQCPLAMFDRMPYLKTEIIVLKKK